MLKESMMISFRNVFFIFQRVPGSRYDAGTHDVYKHERLLKPRSRFVNKSQRIYNHMYIGMCKSFSV